MTGMNCLMALDIQVGTALGLSEVADGINHDEP